MNALELYDVSKVYSGKKRTKVQALTGLSLQVPPGEVFGFLGPNGAGKSTTIKTIMALIKPTIGTVTVFGLPVTEAAARKRIGYLPENPSFYEFMTARELLHFVGRAFAMEESAIERQTDRVLELLELTGAADRPVRGYSKGMVQRLGIAQTMVHDPDIYILDEPMSGLDPLGRALVKEIIKDLKKQGKTVFFSTHITADVEVVCDRVGVIVKGKLQSVDRVDAILQSGVEGYILQVSHDEKGSEEIFVKKDELKTVLKSLAATDSTVERIEPRRKDLEAFFLDIVAKEEHAAQEPL